MIAGIVMGAGRSSRFGTPKQLLALGDTTGLGQVVANANASALDRVIVVLGRAAEDVRDSFDPGRAEVVENTAYATGCASTILTGLDAAGDCEAVALLLGDMPGVAPDVIDRAVDAWLSARPWAAIVSWRGTPGHPFLFARPAFPDLRALHGDKGVFALLERHPDRVLRVPVDAPLPPDVDRPEDYDRLKAAWSD